MSNRVTNIDTASYEAGAAQRDEDPWRYLDLSGEHLGVRVEELPPAGTSSFHHYHTSEEEHVLMLSGAACLYLGDAEIELAEGDHVLFPAGEEVAHHIKNTSSAPCRYLVFGERKKDDVVFYPEASVVLVKSAAGTRQYTYRKRIVED